MPARKASKLPSWESGVGKAGRRGAEDEDDGGEGHWRFAEGSDMVLSRMVRDMKKRKMVYIIDQAGE